MKIINNIHIKGKHTRPILTDVFYTPNNKPKPIVIFAHGFKGFKDWGHFNLIAAYFAQAGFVFVKFNFSHNGTTPQEPTQFADPEAFANNNFSIELDDLGTVIDALSDNKLPIDTQEIDQQRIYLVGHSRGGGIVILKANEDKRIKKIATWAAVSEFGKFWSPSVIKQWQEKGVWYVMNTRTNEQMPMYWQLYENYYANLNRLHIPTAIKQLRIPTLIIHGTNDDAVPHNAATELYNANQTYTQLLSIAQGNHVFGATHPYHAQQLPKHSQEVCDATIAHFNS